MFPNEEDIVMATIIIYNYVKNGGPGFKRQKYYNVLRINKL